MIKKGIITLMLLALLMTPLTVEAHNAVKVSGQTVSITMGNKQTLHGKYIPAYRYIKWNKAWLREYPRTGPNGQVLLKKGNRVGLIWQNNKWSAVMYNKKCYFVENAGLALQPPTKAVYSGAYFRKAGVIIWQGKKYTWYSQRVLPGRGLKIPGRHLDSQGFVCDANNYIVLGSNTANRGKIVATPFGKYGKVYDAGYVTTNWFDCYVGW